MAVAGFIRKIFTPDYHHKSSTFLTKLSKIN
jgi:hypothetical protein